LSYTLTSDPLLGTVEVSPDGTYVYTPGTDFTEYDTFTVAVDSPGFNILNPSGSWQPAQASVSVWGTPGPGGPPDDVLTKPAITRTFEIINLTSSNQRVVPDKGGKGVVSKPPAGTILRPGESTSIVLTQYAFESNFLFSSFTPVDASGAQIPAPSGVFSVTVATQPFGSVWKCNTGNCDTGSTRMVVLLDPPGTVISVPSGQGQKQADVLNSFCSAGRATCSFVPRSFNNTAWSPRQQASSTIRNEGTTNVTRTITVTNSQSTSTNLKLSTKVEGKIFDLVSVAVTAEASQTWTSTYTFSEAIQQTALPGQEIWFETSAPLKSVTGDFFVTLANSTWNLYDVTFTSPDADPKRGIRWYSRAEPFTPGV
jgi:hypothetical protein